MAPPASRSYKTWLPGAFGVAAAAALVLYLCATPGQDVPPLSAETHDPPPLSAEPVEPAVLPEVCSSCAAPADDCSSCAAPDRAADDSLLEHEMTCQPRVTPGEVRPQEE